MLVVLMKYMALIVVALYKVFTVLYEGRIMVGQWWLWCLMVWQWGVMALNGRGMVVRAVAVKVIATEVMVVEVMAVMSGWRCYVDAPVSGVEVAGNGKMDSPLASVTRSEA